MTLDLTYGIESTLNKLSEINTAKAHLSSWLDPEFRENLWSLDINPENYRIVGEPGDYQLVRGDVMIDRLEVVKALNSGDIVALLESLGITEDEMKSSRLTTDQFRQHYKKAYKDQLGIKLIDRRLEEVELSDRLTRELGTPRSSEEFEAIVRNRADVKVQLDAFEKQLAKKGVLKTKGWLKRTVKLAMIGAGVGGLWALIDGHRKAMNGCWLINVRTGEKCKISTLTCNGNTVGECSESATHVCGSYLLSAKNTEPCYARTKCMKKDPMTGECIETLKQACDVVSKKGESCSKYCEHINTPAGYKTLCVSADFWGAAKDLVSTLALSTTGWLKTILLGVAVLVVVVVAAMVVVRLLKSSSSSSSS